MKVRRGGQPSTKSVSNNAVLEDFMKSPEKGRKMILKEAAKYLGVSHRKIGQMVKDGEIDFKKEAAMSDPKEFDTFFSEVTERLLENNWDGEYKFWEAPRILEEKSRSRRPFRFDPNQGKLF